MKCAVEYIYTEVGAVWGLALGIIPCRYSTSAVKYPVGVPNCTSVSARRDVDIEAEHVRRSSCRTDVD